MNKAKRKRLNDAFGFIKQAMAILEEVKSEEESAYENLPESFQNGERGETMENCIDLLDEAYGYLDDANLALEQI